MSSLTIYQTSTPLAITYNPFPMTDLEGNEMGEDLGEFSTLKDAIETGLKELASIGEDFPMTIELASDSYPHPDLPFPEFQTLMRLRDGEYYAKQFLRDVPSIAEFAVRSTKIVNYI